MNDKKIVLVVGMGTSPAVMTQTVWALAHQSESVVPDEIVVITTKSGKDALLAPVIEGVRRVMANARAESDSKPKKKSAPRKTSKGGVNDDTPPARHC